MIDIESFRMAMSPKAKSQPTAVDTIIQTMSENLRYVKKSTTAMRIIATIMARTLSFFILEAFDAAMSGAPTAEIFTSGHCRETLPMALSIAKAIFPLKEDSLVP